MASALQAMGKISLTFRVHIHRILQETLLSNKFLLNHLVIKTSDKNDVSTAPRSCIFKLDFVNKISAYIQFLKQCNEGKS